MFYTIQGIPNQIMIPWIIPTGKNIAPTISRRIAPAAILDTTCVTQAANNVIKNTTASKPVFLFL